VVTGIIILMLVLITGCTGGPGYGQPTPTPSVTEPVTPTFSPTSTPPSTVPITTFPTLPAVVPENISINWAGYVVQTSFDVPEKNAIESVEAVWNVPSVDCSQTGMSDYSSAFWVGIDGFSSVSVEQIGTDSDCIQGSPVYYGWYELYPKDSVTLDLTIRPGDDVHAKVDYLGNNEFRFSLTDITTNQSISIIEMSTIAERSSAEWIAEAPVYRRRILPLSDFGPVDFINASVTIKGHTGSIFSDQWDYRSIVMEATDGTIKATPTGLVNGNSFSIVWEHQ
jgi:hypothetical protein